MEWEAIDFDLRSIDERILALLEKQPCTRPYLADELDVTAEYIYQRVTLLQKLGYVRIIHDGFYELHPDLISPPPLTLRERDVLDHLEQWGDGRDDPTPRDTVIDTLTDGKFEREEADKLIASLLWKGVLSECDDGMRVTTPGTRD